MTDTGASRAGAPRGLRRRMAAAGTVRLRALLAQRGRGGGGAQPGLPGLGGGGHLVVTPGNEIDFNRIESDILDLCQRFQVVSAGFDPWQSTQMAQRLRAEGVNMLEFRATTQNFSPVILELNAALRSGRLRRDGDPALGWCPGNVVGRPTGAATSTAPSIGQSRRSTPRWRC